MPFMLIASHFKVSDEVTKQKQFITSFCNFKLLATDEIVE